MSAISNDIFNWVCSTSGEQNSGSFLVPREIPEFHKFQFHPSSSQKNMIIIPVSEFLSSAEASLLVFE